MIGAGLQGAGLSPAGCGAPEEAPAPGQTATPRLDLTPARALDLRARDYLVDDARDGVPHEAWDGLAQNVVLRLGTRRGSLAFDREFGNDWLNLTRSPGDLAAFGRRCVDQALVELVRSQQVAVVSTTVEQLGGVAVLVVVWRDLRTGRDAAPVRLPRL